MAPARSATRVGRRVGAREISSPVSIFDETEIEAGHQRLASSISSEMEALVASTDLIRKSALNWKPATSDHEDQLDYLAASTQLALRIVNDVGAASKLIDCGYFVQSAALLRSVAEVGMLTLLFSQIPSDLRVWRNIEDGKRHSKFGRPRLTKTIFDQAKFTTLNSFFNAFSEYGVHPSSTSITANLNNNKIYPGAHLNELLYKKTYLEMARLCWLSTDVLGDAAFALFAFAPEDHFPDEVKRYRNSAAKLFEPLPPVPPPAKPNLLQPHGGRHE